MNFTAGKVRKDTVYFWDFGSDNTFYGVNPLSHKFSIGKHRVTLRVLDIKTGDFQDENFLIVVEKLVSVKKAKTPQVVPIKIEKPLVVR